MDTRTTVGAHGGKEAKADLSEFVQQRRLRASEIWPGR